MRHFTTGSNASARRNLIARAAWPVTKTLASNWAGEIEVLERRQMMAGHHSGAVLATSADTHVNLAPRRPGQNDTPLPAQIKLGDEVTLRFPVRNLGSDHADGTALDEVYLSDDEDTDVRTG